MPRFMPWCLWSQEKFHSRPSHLPTVAASRKSFARAVARAPLLSCASPKPTGKKERRARSEEHTSELQSLRHLVCRLLLDKKNPAEGMVRLFLQPQLQAHGSRLQRRQRAASAVTCDRPREHRQGPALHARRAAVWADHFS